MQAPEAISENQRSNAPAIGIITKGGLSSAHMKDLINDGAPKIRSIVGKKIVLILGNTGSGKSTTINYLLGGKMKDTSTRYQPKAELIDGKDEKAKIGHNLGQSETLFPQAYGDNEKSLHYCDCPGFLENRGLEEIVIVPTSIKAAVQSAEGINGIVLIIEYSTIITDRGSGLVNLSKLLSQLFKEPANLNRSIMLVITKAPELQIKDLKNNIDQIKIGRQKSFISLRDKFFNFFSQNKKAPEAMEKEMEENKQVISILELFSQDNFNNAHILDIFDDFSSKKVIENFLSNCEPMSTSNFKFSNYDTESIKFDEALVQIVDANLNLLNNRNNLIESINQKREKIVEINKIIKSLDEHLKSLDEKKEEDPEKIKLNEKSLTKQISEKQEKIDKLNGSKIYLLSALPTQDKLINYNNSYIIISEGINLQLKYINRQGHAHNLDYDEYGYGYYKHRLNNIIGELRGNCKLFDTIDSEVKSEIDKIILKYFNNRFPFLFNSKTVPQGIFFLEKVPDSKDIFKYSKSFLIIREKEKGIDSEKNINNWKWKFFVVKDEKTIIDVEKDINFALKQQLMQYGTVEIDKSLNDTLSIPQLSRIYREIAEWSFHGGDCRDNIILINRRMEEIKRYLQQIDSDEPVLYWTESIKEKSSSFGWLLKSTTVKTFKYQGEPIEKIVEEVKNGVLKVETKIEHEGKYSSTYQSNPSEDADATIKIYIKQKNTPGNQALIRLLKLDLKKQSELLDIYKMDITGNEQAMSSLQVALARYSFEERVSQKRKLNDHIENNKNETIKLQIQVKELENKLRTIDVSCQESHNTFESTLFFIKTLGLEHPYYTKFITQYELYHQSFKQSLKDLEIAENSSIFDIHRASYHSIEKFDPEIYKSCINKAIQKNIDIHKLDDQNRNIIHHLIEDNLENVLQFYIQKGVSVDIYNKKGETPFFTAVRIGNLNALKKFQDLNFSFVDITMIDGNNLLHYALYHHQMPIFKWLSDKVLRNRTNVLGHTPLYIAATQKNEKAVQILVGSNHSIQLCSDSLNQHYSIIHQLIEKNSFDAIILIEKYVDKDLLIQSLKFYYSKSKSDYLKSKFNVRKSLEKSDNDHQTMLAHDNYQGESDGELPIVYALRSGNIAIIKWLLSIPGPMEKLNSNNSNVFHLAAEYGNKEILELIRNILQKEPCEESNMLKLYINQLDQNGYSPLHIAINAKNIQTVGWFLSQSTVDKDKLTKPLDKINPRQTALHLALASRDEAITKKLIECEGVGLSTPNSLGLTPMIFAKQENMRTSKALLKQKICMLFLEAIQRNLKTYFNETHYKLLTNSEKENLLRVINERSKYCIDKNDEISKKIRKKILNYHQLTPIQISNISRQISVQVKDQLEIHTNKDIFFSALHKGDFRELDQLLLSCFSSLVTIEISSNNIEDNPTSGLHIFQNDVFNLKKQGFCRALGESLRYLYYVNLALIEREVDPKSSNFNTALSAFSTITPTLSGYVSKMPEDTFGDMKTNLAFTLLNAFFLLIREYEKSQAINAAERVVHAFQGGYRMVDTDCIDAITEAFYQRFKDQINQMSISISTNKKLRLHEEDGVVQFAYVIARRIGVHILQDRNKVIGESNIAICRGINNASQFFKQGWQKVFGQVQNLTANQPMPILQRCMLAIWNEIDGLDKKIELDIFDGGKNKIWLAGHILTQTGYRLISDNDKYFKREGHFCEDIGFCYVTMEEIEARGNYIAIEKPLEKISLKPPSMSMR